MSMIEDEHASPRRRMREETSGLPQPTWLQPGTSVHDEKIYLFAEKW